MYHKRDFIKEYADGIRAHDSGKEYGWNKSIK